MQEIIIRVDRVHRHVLLFSFCFYERYFLKNSDKKEVKLRFYIPLENNIKSLYVYMTLKRRARKCRFYQGNVLRYN